MPALRSLSRGARPAAPSRNYRSIIVIGLAALLAVIVAALPASMITHFLPAWVHAEDFSGSIWHGSAGKISVYARDAGALEWRLHPSALLGMAVALDLHWVKIGFVVDAAANIDRRGISLHTVNGTGPIEDLRDLGVPAGWRGTASIDFTGLKADFAKPLAAVGDVRVSNLTSAQIADADLGGYDLRFTESAVGSDGNVTAQLTDTGGPLDLRAIVHYTASERACTLTGTLKERPDAPAALRSRLESLSQLRGRDSQGRIPVDLELAL